MEEPSELLHQLLMEDDISIDKLTECLRTLRNVCASNSDVQSQLGQRDTLLKDVNLAIERGLNAVDSDQWTLFLRICSQFLGNFVVNNPDNQQKVWKQCSSQLKRMAHRGDSKLTYVCLMILYNIVLGSPHLIRDLVGDEELIKIICLSGAEGVEYAQFIIEHLYNQEVDWSKIYNSSVPISGRLFLLDMIEGAENELPTSLISQLATHFRKQSDCILRTVADRVNTLEPEEVSQLLRLLASKSPHPPHLQALQQDRNFFINCAFLLKSIHMAGKEENNCFAPVAKLSQAGDQLNQHPAFEFKANLVRLLGNLCYKHKENQDMMRDLEIIPILLDCCNMDARNPFIIQWVVLAVRNLCEANPANQSMIAGLTREGLVQSALLTELGITLHDDGENKINVVPLRSTTDR